MPKRINIFIAAFLTGCFFLSCENDRTEVNSLNKKILGVEEGRDVVLNYTIGGNIKTILKAPRMLRVQDSIPYIEFPDSLKADFYDENGTLESVLTARYGNYKENQNIVFLRDNVKVINIQKGDTLYCEELYWDRSRLNREFYTDKPVKIRTRTQILDGIGMEARQDFKEYHIIQVTGIIDVPMARFP